MDACCLDNIMEFKHNFVFLSNTYIIIYNLRARAYISMTNNGFHASITKPLLVY